VRNLPKVLLAEFMVISTLDHISNAKGIPFWEKTFERFMAERQTGPLPGLQFIW
jgi:hypothetical protein